MRSVVYLIEHQKEGSIGLLLNQPSSQTTSELLGTIEPALLKVPVFTGGPVSPDQLIFVAFWWEGTLQTKTHLSLQQAAEYLEKPGTRVFAFLGHSGWEKGQLESEIRQNAWVITPPDPRLFESSHLDLWSILMRDISPYHAMIAESPTNPYLN